MEIAQRPLTIREAQVSDADILRAIDLRVVEDGRGVVRLPKDVRPIEVFRERIQSALDSPRQHMIVAEVDGEVAGEGSVGIRPVSLCKHVAALDLQVDPLRQGRGVGRAILETLVAWVDARSVERLELFVRGDNTRAIALYRSVGFSIEATRHAYIAPVDQPRVHDYIMVRWAGVPDRTLAVAAVASEERLLVWTDPVFGAQLPSVPIVEGLDPNDALRKAIWERSGLSLEAPAGSLGAWTTIDTDGRKVRWQVARFAAGSGSVSGEGRFIPLDDRTLARLPLDVAEIAGRLRAA